MLRNLHIQNYALIESLDIDFHPGFSVITGETGAGKSIILGALGMILGQRADVRSIKQGTKRCVVEATFDLSGFDVKSFFDDNNLDFDGVECIVRRELAVTGKSRAFINDTPVPATLLRELSSRLIDIHSQHQNLLLSDVQFQMGVVDTVAKNDALRSEYDALYKAWKDAEKSYKNVLEKTDKDKDNFDFLSFQLNEIDKARLQPDEQEELEEESTMLENAESIKGGLYRADRLLSDEDKGVSSKLSECLDILRDLNDVFPETRALCERLDSCTIEIDDIAQEVSDKLENFNYEPGRLDFVNERLSTIYALEKKHHCENIQALLDYADRLRSQIDNVENSEALIAQLKEDVRRMKNAVTECATRLTGTRRESAKKIEKEMMERLKDLGMPNIRFEVSIEPREEPDSHGMDNVTFRFSANKNAPLQDLAQIASGGEIARVMLSLKAMLSARTQLSTIIFDEIDTGISGRIAEKMALVMRQMSQSGRQVISITHLPQIAALGDFQYKVYKDEKGETTETHIRELSPDERIIEIAHLLSGEKLTDAAINNAKELLNPKIICTKK